jgi:serine/threonine protein kinase/predicted ATPase
VQRRLEVVVALVNLPLVVQLPKRIGNFDVLGELGRGGMGVVYKVKTPVTGQIAALKMVPTEALDKPDSRLRFMREFRSMKRVEHPNICRVFETGTHDECPFFTMEFIEGKEIRRWLDGDEPILTHNRDRPPEPPFSDEQLDKLNDPDRIRRIIDVTTQVAYALGEIHAHRIVHRDLKPDNILVTGAGVAKLMDFGIAKQLSAGGEQSSGGMLLGTFKYLAPEQALGTTIDGRADLYCLGLILFELLVGRHPFYSDNGVGYAFLHARKELPPVASFNPRLEPGLAAVVDRMVRKQPNERLATADDVIAALRDGYANAPRQETSDRHPVGALPRVPRRPQVFQPAMSGRGVELDRLQQMVQGLQHGRASVVAIHGAPGSGKSRLLRETSLLAKTRQVDVLIGRCTAGGAPYHPFVGILEQVVDDLAALPGDAQRNLIGAEAQVLGRYVSLHRLAAEARGRPAGALEPHSERLRMQAAMTSLLTRLSGVRPRVLAIDDLHFADELSLGLLRHLADTLARPDLDHSMQRGATIALLLAHDPEHALAGAVSASLERMGRTTPLLLKPLSIVDVTDMLRSMLGGGEVSPALAEYLVAEHGGWPGVLEERIRAWVESGTLARRGRQWVMPRRAADLVAPAAVEVRKVTRLDVELAAPRADVHADRVAQLPAITREVGCRAALQGTRFAMGLLVLSALRPEEEVVDAVDDLIRRGMLEEDKETLALQFVDDADRAALMNTLSPERKRQLHMSLAAALIEDARRQRKLPVAEELAGHYIAAAATIEAIGQLMIAARRALAVSATQTAAGHVRAAQELLGQHQRSTERPSTDTIVPINDPTVSRVDAELVMLRLDVLAAVNEHKECVSLARRRLPRLDKSVDASLVAEVTLRLASSERALGELDVALEHTAFVLRATERGAHGQGHALRCRAKSLAGSIYEQRGDLDTATRYFDDALALAQTLGDIVEEERARTAIAYRLLRNGSLADAEREFQQLLQRAQARGESLSVANYIRALGAVAHERGQYDEAEVAYRRIVELARPAGDRRSLALALCHISVLRLDQDRFHDAALLSQKALRMVKDLDQAALLAQATLVSSHIALSRGGRRRTIAADDADAKDALRAGEEALVLAERSHAALEQLEARLCVALAQHRLGTDNLAVMRALSQDVAGHQHRSLWFFSQECVYEQLARSRATSAARAIMDEVMREAGRYGFARSLQRLQDLKLRWQGGGEA